MQKAVANVLASSVGLVALVGMVTVAVTLTKPAEHFWLYEFLGCLFTVPMAFAMWSGFVWSRRDKPAAGPSTWRDWLLFFLVALATSAAFLLMDVYVFQGRPGLGAIFTVGAIAMSVVALPSALRSWLLELLAR